MQTLRGKKTIKPIQQRKIYVNFTIFLTEAKGEAGGVAIKYNAEPHNEGITLLKRGSVLAFFPHGLQLQQCQTTKRILLTY